MRAEDINHQCLRCHRFFGGPAAVAHLPNPGEKILSVNAETGEVSPTIDERHPFNVSHGFCEKCKMRWLEEEHRGIFRRRDYRRVEDELARRRLFRRPPPPDTGA